MGSINLIDTIKKTKLKNIPLNDGNVLHGLKSNETSFAGFGEVYFSKINYNSIKSWKKHSIMIMNLIVPLGEVKFVFYDNENKTFREEIIGEENYYRLTIPPNIWFGFQGLFNPYSLIMNVSNIEHDPKEVENQRNNFIDYKW